MVRRVRLIVRHLPRAGAVRLYHPADRPILLPGERLVPDHAEHGHLRPIPSWIVEPVPGRVAALDRLCWHVAGRWVWAVWHVAGFCQCLTHDTACALMRRAS